SYSLRTYESGQERLDLLVGGALQRQQPALRPVAVSDDQLMFGGDRRQRFGGDPDVAPLIFCSHRFAASEECVAAQGGDDQHDQSPSVATRIALMVCMRFSACSNAML